mgnify:CR=1 FL=1
MDIRHEHSIILDDLENRHRRNIPEHQSGKNSKTIKKDHPSF